MNTEGYISIFLMKKKAKQFFELIIYELKTVKAIMFQAMHIRDAKLLANV